MSITITSQLICLQPQRACQSLGEFVTSIHSSSPSLEILAQVWWPQGWWFVYQVVMKEHLPDLIHLLSLVLAASILHSENRLVQVILWQ